jgi:hypothetical protein
MLRVWRRPPPSRVPKGVCPMNRPRLVCKPSSTATRLLLTHNEQVLLRAVLPAPSQAHWRAAPTLCEALALWLQQPLSVALCADAGGTSPALTLCDGFGFGDHRLHYEVEVVEPGRKRSPRPLGSFGDLRQLELALRDGK